MFGTTVAEALPGLLNVRALTAARYPATAVRIAFTSPTVRRTWRARAADPDYRIAHPLVPADIFAVRSPLDTIASLQAEGCEAVVVQPVHMAPAEEYRDLRRTVTDLAGHRSPHRLPARMALGRPVLGEGPAGEEGETVAAAGALAADADLARAHGAALLYMGHGSKGFAAGPLYLHFAQAMRSLYPRVLTCVALVEGKPSLAETLPQLRRHAVRRVVLKPLMVAAGTHARRDMIGPPPRGWQHVLEGAGYEVVPVLSGLGEQDAFAGIIVRHAAEAAAAAGIVLR
jgi:sirohydrochlorin cobaltochelatase